MKVLTTSLNLIVVLTLLLSSVMSSMVNLESDTSKHHHHHKSLKQSSSSSKKHSNEIVHDTDDDDDDKPPKPKKFIPERDQQWIKHGHVTTLINHRHLPCDEFNDQHSEHSSFDDDFLQSLNDLIWN